ncbi:MAG: FAD-dependent oxidoreductase, partial [Candidatus Odinarchaeia archaeon]
MDIKNIVIVGLNAAGLGAAISARRTNPNANITLVDKEKYTAYSRCGIPFVISGEVAKFEDLIDFPRSFYEQMNFNL